jgi:ABC-type dipeptide/oligopeptide/nickel transport system ATPase component
LEKTNASETSPSTPITMGSSASDLLKISDLSVSFTIEKFQINALNKVNLRLGESTRGGLGIVGESGSGKTTLGLAILNLIEAPGKVTNGSIEYMGKNILDFSEGDLRKYRWKQVSMVHQSAMNSLNSTLSRENAK